MEILSRKDWVRKYYPQAVAATKGSRIFPETMLAMAVVESQGEAKDGNYYPGLGLTARKANNYFGIKDSPTWKGETIQLPTSKDAKKVSTFRKYNSVEESIADFVKFLQINPIYTKAGVFAAKDYVEQIVAIARAGYAENPNYRKVITSVARKVQEYTKDLATPVNNNSKNILPLLIAGLLIGAFFLSNKLQG